MHYVIEKSNKILGEEKEKTGGVHTAYTHPEHSKWNIEGEVKEKGKGQGNPGQGNQSFFGFDNKGRDKKKSIFFKGKVLNYGWVGVKSPKLVNMWKYALFFY